MRKKISFMLIVMCLLSLPAAAWASPLVRIGIINGKDTVTVSAQRPFKILNARDKSVIAKGQANDKWRVEYRSGQLYLNNQLMREAFVFTLEPGKDDAYLMVDGRRYRGEVEIRPAQTKQGITVIEILPMEEYLYGIIPWEISPAWPVEAVKAQAVAARTYALYHIGKHKKDDFDICNTTDCQVYGGREAEDPRGNWAVDATRGMVVTYKNKLVPTFFHSSSGGYTENVENVWSGKMDYLRAVPDYDQGSPYFRWKTVFTPEEISKRLASAGHNVGVIEGIKLSPLRQGIEDSADRGISGRVKTMTFIGSQRAVTLSGNTVRQLFQLNSTLFDVRLPEPVKQQPAPEPSKPAETKPALAKSGSFAARIQSILQEYQEKTQTRNTNTASVPPAKNVNPQTAATAVISFEGHGSGHGLGLSQWGAKAMAEQGPQDDRTYYQQILKHYYQGVDITKWY